jgi:exopolysaccharide biosynthesis polyprenyl glycosylphosphotransferase
MYPGRKQQFDWAFSLKVGDLAAIALSFLITFAIWPAVASDIAIPAADRATALNCIFYGALILFFLNEFHLYAWQPFIQYPALGKKLPFALLASLGVFLGTHYMVSSPGDPAHLPFLFVHLGIDFLLISALRLLVRFADASLGGISTERIAFVGWSPRLENVLIGIQQGMGRFQKTLGFFHTGQPEGDGALKGGYQALGSLGQLEQIIEQHKITLLLVDERQIPISDLRQIADRCADLMVSLKMIPSTFDIWANRLTVRVVAGVPLMGIYDLHHDHFGNRAMKRLVDVACSLFGLAVSVPIIAILSVLIHRESPGPIFYRQKRLGLYGEPFEIIKLRSMRLDAEQQSGAVWAVAGDPRRLKIGAFMRKWNLDELPQFWNILKGEMSMVGPRPARPEFVESFRDTVRYYNLRHTCKCGLTGWAAVHGLRGDTSLEDRLEYDLYYIANWSLLLDFRIMLMTLAPPKNAY